MQPFPYAYSYNELEERVNAPDEDWDAYMRRLRSTSALNALGTSSNKAHTPSGEVFAPIDSGPSVSPTLPRPSSPGPITTTTKKRGISTIQKSVDRSADRTSKKRKLINPTDPVTHTSSDAKQAGPARDPPTPNVGPKAPRVSKANSTTSNKLTLLKTHPPVPSLASKDAHDDVVKQMPHTVDTPIARPTPPAKHPRAKHPIVPAETSVITTPGRSPPTKSPAPAPPVRAATAAALQMQTLRPEIQRASSSAHKTSSAKANAQKPAPKKFTPSEYARALMQRVSDPPPTPPEAPPARKTLKKPPRILKAQMTVKRAAQQPQHLKGYNIFYTNGDMHYATETTRKKMDYIVKLGGTLVPEFDPAVVTHIVTDAGAGPTARALGLKSLSDIPQEIPTLTWKWVNFYTTEKDASGNLVHNKGLEFLFAAFQERRGAGRGWARNMSVGGAGKEHATREGKGKEPEPGPREEAGEQVSHISDFTEASIEIADRRPKAVKPSGDARFASPTSKAP